jgi:FkbM family methyltransferase
MPLSLKELVKRVPGVNFVARRVGLSSQGSWLFRRHVLTWTTEPAVVGQLSLPYRLFARYAAAYFARTEARDLLAGRLVFRAAAVARRLTKEANPLAQLCVDGLDVVVNLDDPRFLQVVNELSRRVDTSALRELVKEGDTFMDIGANHGAFALVASQIVGTSGRVVAVEPQPLLAEAVERSLRATALGPFEVHALALGDRSGTVDLFIPLSYSGTAGLFAGHSGTHPHRRVAVPLRRCDDALDWQRFPGSLFVKLDVEGSEYAFLEGAREMIRARRPVLLMELNATSMAASGTSEGALKTLLGELGYGAYAELETPHTRLPLTELDLNIGDRNILIFNASSGA